MSVIFELEDKLTDQEIADGWNLTDDGIMFRVKCKSGEWCKLKPKGMDEVNCKTCDVKWIKEIKHIKYDNDNHK